MCPRDVTWQATPFIGVVKLMSIFGRVVAISVGALGGGGLGFWYRETYWCTRKEIERQKLEEELKRLIELRRDKEMILTKLMNKTT